MQKEAQHLSWSSYPCWEDCTASAPSHGIMQYYMLIPREDIFMKWFSYLLFLHWRPWVLPKLSTYCWLGDERRNVDLFSQIFSITVIQMFCVLKYEVKVVCIGLTRLPSVWNCSCSSQLARSFWGIRFSVMQNEAVIYNSSNFCICILIL